MNIYEYLIPGTKGVIKKLYQLLAKLLFLIWYQYLPQIVQSVNPYLWVGFFDGCNSIINSIVPMSLSCDACGFPSLRKSLLAWK